MSWMDLAVSALAAACFNLICWCLSLSRRLGRVERTSRSARQTVAMSRQPAVASEAAQRLGQEGPQPDTTAVDMGRSAVPHPELRGDDCIPRPVVDSATALFEHRHQAHLVAQTLRP